MHQQTHKKNLIKKKNTIANMFNRIAPRYDLLNRIVSMGQDIKWRKKLSIYLPNKHNIEQLDLATGTGDIPIMLKETPEGKKIKHALGLDISTEMIKVGQKKIKKKNLNHIIQLKEGDATQIDLPNNSKDLITMAFGIRNVNNVEKTLLEMKRVLRKEGRLLILEFSLPKIKPIKWIYLIYFRHILPIIGGFITGNYKALKYLNQSVEAFPYGNAFLKKLQEAGFKNTKATTLCFGVASIYQGDV